MAMAVVLILAAAPLSAQESPRRPAEGGEIVVSGTGEVRALPDRATLVVGVETEAGSARQAAAGNAQRQTSVLAALRRQGVADNDLVTSSYAVRQQRDRDGRAVGRYTATNIVEVRTARLDRLGEIIDTALAAGANRVGDPQYIVSNVEEYEERALALAIEQARHRAAAAAKAAGGDLGGLIQVTTEGNNPGFGPGMRLNSLVVSGYAAPTPIVTREQSIAVTVVGRWQFVPRP